MEQRQIREVTETHNDAGTKANADIALIAADEGFACLELKQDASADSFTGKMIRQKGYLRDLREIRRGIPQGSVVLLQHPFHHKQLTRNYTMNYLKEKKNCRFICAVHDVEELRGYRFSKYYAEEFGTMLELADQLIVHNINMKKWFIELGVPEEKLISLECFDYLVSPGFRPKERRIGEERSIAVAGNLDPAKSGYIGGLEAMTKIQVHLYGPNYAQRPEKRGRVIYHGSLSPEKLPAEIDGSFGLVWDGPSADTCGGDAGKYLRYNNPHKLSLYLASGMPVVVWNEAAAAGFVKENGIGLTVASLAEAVKAIETIPAGEYSEMISRVNAVGSKLREGYYTKHALKTAMERLEQ